MATRLTLEELEKHPNRKSLAWAWYSLSRFRWKWKSWPIMVIQAVSPHVDSLLVGQQTKMKPIEVIQDAIQTRDGWLDLQFLYHDFILRIIPRDMWNETDKVIAQLQLYMDYDVVSDFLNKLPDGATMTWLPYSNYLTIGLKRTLDDRAKYLSEWVQRLVSDLENAR